MSDAAIRFDSTPASPLLDYLDARVDKLRHAVPAAFRDWDLDAVHDARVTTRRLHAAIGLLEPVLQKQHRKAFDKPLRKLRKSLGDIRDTDVMLGHLADQPGDGPRDAEAWMAGLLRERRRRAEHALADTSVTKLLDKLDAWAAVRGDIAEAADAIGCLLAESVHLQLNAFAEQADTLVAKAEPDETDATADPHLVRIAGKALRYTLELTDAAGFALPDGAAAAFKAMQDALGLWHDFVVLSNAVARAAVEYELALHDTPLHAKTMDLSRRTADAAVGHLSAFINVWQSQGPPLADGLRIAFPLTRDVSLAAGEAAKPSPSAADGVLSSGEDDTIRPSIDENA